MVSNLAGERVRHLMCLCAQESALHPSLFRRSKSLELTGAICRGERELARPGSHLFLCPPVSISQQEGEGGKNTGRREIVEVWLVWQKSLKLIRLCELVNLDFTDVLRRHLYTSIRRFREIPVLCMQLSDDKLGVNCEWNVEKIAFVSV
jgi:hypothetical protein